MRYDVQATNKCRSLFYSRDVTFDPQTIQTDSIRGFYEWLNNFREDDQDDPGVKSC